MHFCLFKKGKNGGKNQDGVYREAFENKNMDSFATKQVIPSLLFFWMQLVKY
jgi:hypothetical protein